MIHLGIKQKIFLLILCGTLTVVLVMTFFVRWSFDRGFLRYANTVEQNRLSQFASQMDDVYQQLGGWQRLRDAPQLWPRLLRRSPLEPLSEPGPHRMMHRGHHRMDPQRRGLAARLQLVDADKNHIAGRRQLENAQYQPIRVDGQTVGYLALAPQKRLANDFQLRFAQEQRKTFIAIGLGMVLLVALLSLPLSQRLVRRLQAITTGAREMTEGNYTVQVPATGHDELGQLGRDFNRLATTLKKNEKARRDWVADISHELRTPLSVLRGEIEAIQDGVRQPSAQTLAVLHSEVMALNRLVEDLYQLSRSDAGSLSYRKQPLLLAPELNAAVNAFSPLFAQKDILLNLQAKGAQSIELMADGERLQQLFSNLLENSLRYTDRGGRAEVCYQQRGTEVVITFCDSAPGVEAAERGRLFERLFRVDSSRNRATGGRGLGLSICQNIVEAHEGRISAEPSPWGGLCLEVVLPIVEKSKPGAAA